MFVCKFHVGKIIFHHCWPTPGKMRFPTTCQSSLLPLLEKNLCEAHAPLCVDQQFSIFCTCPTIHQTHHFATPHPCWFNNTNKTMFSSFQLTKTFWSRSHKLYDVGARSVAKNFRCLELEPEPESEIRVPDPLLQSTIRKLHLLR